MEYLESSMKPSSSSIDSDLAAVVKGEQTHKFLFTFGHALQGASVETVVETWHFDTFP